MKADLRRVGWFRKRKEFYWERNGQGAEDVCHYFLLGGSLPPAHGGLRSTDDTKLSIPWRNITL